MEIPRDSAKKHFVGLINSGALEVEESNALLLSLHLNRKVLALPGFFALAGTLSILWYFGALGGVFAGVQKVIGIPIIGALLIIISIVVGLRSRLQLVFDKKEGTFEAKMHLPFGTGHKVHELPLGEITAVQILYARPTAGCACGGASGVYEINLVSKRPGNERIGLVLDRQKGEAEKLAGRIAGFLNVELIDHSGGSCCV